MKALFLILAALLLMTPARAETQAPDPVPVTLENLVKAAAKLGAINLDDDRMLDDYARIVHCDVYQRFHPDEFTWREVRTAMRQSIALNKDKFPTSFYLYRTETFGQYDFASHTLPLTGDSLMRRTAFLQMMNFADSGFTACGDKLEALPSDFIAVLDKPLQMEAIPLPENQAAMVVRYFDASGAGRIGYGRYLVSLFNGGINNSHGEHRLDYSAHLDNIEFYLDSGFQQKFWSGIDTPLISKAPDHYSSLGEIPFKGVDTSTTDTPAPLPMPETLPATVPAP
jgi:hypothetical protein